MRACMGAGLHECMGSQADLGKGVVAEGEVDAVGHLQTVQLALTDVGQAAPDQRHLPAQDAQRVQGNECTVPAAGSILSGLSFTLQLARYHREPVLATEYALLHAGQPLQTTGISMPRICSTLTALLCSASICAYFALLRCRHLSHHALPLTCQDDDGVSYICCCIELTQVTICQAHLGRHWH